MVKVSIIVPVYNVEAYIARCLQSLVDQTLDEIEIVVVNDGSTDQSQSIIDQFQKDYPHKIQSFIKENGGLSDARNFGLDHAQGEFIGFVDSDDYVTNLMFEEMYDLALKHDAEMVICNLQKVNEKDEVTQKLTQIPNLEEKIILKNHLSVFSDISYFACNKLFKKELFHNHRFKKGVHFEDIELIPKLLLQCSIIAQTQNYHYQYFERADSISKTHTIKGLDILKAVESVEVFFEKSMYSAHEKDLRNFQILEGVYTFLAYLAFVKDDEVYHQMKGYFKEFVEERNIKLSNILNYSRFGKNYILNLPFRKKLCYLLFFANQHKIIRKII